MVPWQAGSQAEPGGPPSPLTVRGQHRNAPRQGLPPGTGRPVVSGGDPSAVPSGGGSAAYEAARDILGELVAIAAAHLDAEPPAAAAENWRRCLGAWTDQLDALRPGDSQAVNAVLTSGGQLLARLRAEES